MKYVVGDIHGEIDKLLKLLHFIKSSDNDASFIFIGDYLDKGQNSLATIEVLKEYCLTDTHTFLWGNHEYMWDKAAGGNEEAIAYLNRYGGRTTAQDYGYSSIQAAAPAVLQHAEGLFSRLQKYAVYHGTLVIHAGIDEVDEYKSIDEVPITALAFSRYPFIQRQSATYGYSLTVFGHTGFYTPYRDPYKIGVDTAAVYLKDQPLTAYCIDDDTFVDSTAQRYTIPQQSPSCPVIPRVKPYRNLIT